MAKKLSTSDLIQNIAEETGQTQDAVKTILSALTEQVLKAAENGQDVALHGLGTFKRTERAARKGRNPSTGEELQIAASSSITLKAAQAAKDRLNA